MSDLSELIKEIGEDEALDILKLHSQQERLSRENVLTIVVNRGVHHLPSENLRGTVYYASEGNLDFSSSESVKGEFEKILDGVSEVLKGKNWKQVFVVPFGPCALSMQIKLLVYRITRIESTEVFYLGEGRYIDLKLKQRRIIVKTD